MKRIASRNYGVSRAEVDHPTAAQSDGLFSRRSEWHRNGRFSFHNT